jgi:hypothetical protein
MSRYLSGADPTKVISAKAETHPKFPQIDIAATATLAFPTPGESTGPADNAQCTFPASPTVWLHSAVAEDVRACYWDAWGS